MDPGPILKEESRTQDLDSSTVKYEKTLHMESIPIFSLSDVLGTLVIVKNVKQYFAGFFYPKFLIAAIVFGVHFSNINMKIQNSKIQKSNTFNCLTVNEHRNGTQFL